MKTPKKDILSLIIILAMAFSAVALADSTAYSTVGVSGYDLVSYRTGEKPQVGNGNHLVVHDGVTYLFTSKRNKIKFAANPAKYLPAYGGWCAYGVAVGKKFVGDPDVWEIVDAKLYLNLDNKIKATIESPTARIGYQPKDLYLVSSISELKQKMKGAAWFCL